MRVLVTGGAGFIGSHLVSELRSDAHRIRVLDDCSTGFAHRVPREAELIRADVRDREVVSTAVAGCDLVIHLAAAVGPRMVAEEPIETWTRNVDGTAAVLDACVRHGARVIIASSSEVYGCGDPVRHQKPAFMSETDPIALDPAGRRDVYALSKVAGEAYALALHRSRLLPVTVVRFFNVVGPGQSDRYGMVLARFAAAARAGRPLPVYGDGTQTRCFLHVRDAVAALRGLAGCSAAEGRIVNIGSEDEITILELARRVAAAAGRNAGIEHIPFERVYGPGFRDPVSRKPNLAVLHELIDFAPRHDLDDAIRDVLASTASAPR